MYSVGSGVSKLVRLVQVWVAGSRIPNPPSLQKIQREATQSLPSGAKRRPRISSPPIPVLLGRRRLHSGFWALEGETVGIVEVSASRLRSNHLAMDRLEGMLVERMDDF